MGKADRVLAIVAAAVAMMSLVFAISGPGIPLPAGAGHTSSILYLAVGFGAGVGIMSFLSAMDERKAPLAWVYVVLFCAAVMVVAAAHVDRLSPIHAVLVVILGSVALVAAANALELFRQGDTVALQSNWGGLGAGLGGWSLSPVTSLSVLALVFAGAAITVTYQAGGNVEARQTTPNKESPAASKQQTGQGGEQPASPPSVSPTAPTPAKVGR